MLIFPRDIEENKMGCFFLLKHGVRTRSNMQTCVAAADRQVEIRIQNVAFVHPVVLRVIAL